MSDWVNREYVESIRLHVKRLVSILNELDHNARGHLAEMDQRLDSIERKLEQLEGATERTITNL